MAGIDGETNSGRLFELSDLKEVRHVGRGKATGVLWGLTDALAFASLETYGGPNNPAELQVLDGRAKSLFRTKTGHLGRIVGLAISPDGKYVASTGVTRLVSVRSTRTGKVIGKRQFADHGLGAVTFSPDSKGLYVATDNQVVQQWDMKLRKMRAQFVHAAGTESVVVTEDGYYLGTRGALDKLALRRENHAYPFELFDLALNQPHRVLAALGKSSKPRIASVRRAYERRLAKFGLKRAPKLDLRSLPTATLASQPPLSTDVKGLSFELQAKAQSGTLTRYQVTVNGVPLYGAGGRPLAVPSKNLSEKISLQLSDGTNAVSVSVSDSKGRASLPQSFTTELTGPKPPERLFVVAVGVSKYKDADYNLGYASKDAQDLTKALQGLAPAGRVKTLKLLDSQVTREGFAKVRTFVEQATVDDRVVLFLAGHGLLDADNNYYFATSDVDFSNPTARGLRYEVVESVLDGIAARKKLLLMDTCNSGEVEAGEQALPVPLTGGAIALKARGLKRKPSDKAPPARSVTKDELRSFLGQLFADLRQQSGTVVISSASGMEVALESSQWRNGAFTFALLEGLHERKADTDKNGTMMVSELRDYVFGRVRTLTGGLQNPTVRQDLLRWDFGL